MRLQANFTYSRTGLTPFANIVIPEGGGSGFDFVEAVPVDEVFFSRKSTFGPRVGT